jgi:cytochrome c-type biogenesis protein
MSELLQAFALGNTAILTNVCMLPLYPGLIAYMAGTSGKDGGKPSPWLGFMVLLGILTLMLGVGWLLFTLKQSFGAVLTWVLPVIYFTVFVLGVLMMTGRNPFSRLSTTQIPLLKNPLAGAYLYGLLLGPMTLPCAGPIVVSAFLVGSASTERLVGGLLYFLFFGLGFGWPLVVLPFLALPLQRRFTSWTTTNYTALTRASGALLIGIAAFGVYNDLLPTI